MNNRERIVRVKFHRSRPNGEAEYYFGSMSAIFDMFSKDDIGCSLHTLWAANIDVNRPKHYEMLHDFPAFRVQEET